MTSRTPATRALRAAALAALLAAFLAACGGESAPPPAETPESEPAVASSTLPPAEPETPGDPETAPVMGAQLTIVAYGPDDVPATVELAVHDPLARTTGVGSVGGRVYESIPESRYELVGVRRDSTRASEETAPLVTVSHPAAGDWTAEVLGREATRYRIDVRAAFDDGTGRRASAPWEEIGAGEKRRWRITYDPGDPASFALESIP